MTTAIAPHREYRTGFHVTGTASSWTVKLDDLPTSMTYTVRLGLKPTTAGTITYGPQAWRPAVGIYSTVSIPYDPATGWAITGANLNAQSGVTVTVTTAQDLPPDPLPAHVIRVEAETSIAPMTWDTSTWDSQPWDTSSARRYTDLTPPVTSVTIARGADALGPYKLARTGTATITMTAPSLRQVAAIEYGSRIRVLYWPTATPLFTGRVTDVAVSRDKTGRETATISAVDAVADIAAHTQHGITIDHGAAAEDPVARLVRLARNAAVNINLGTGLDNIMQGNTVWETSTANYIDATIVSADASWWVASEGLVCFGRRGIGSLTLTDRPAQPPTIEATGIDATTSLQPQYTRVELTHHSTKRDTTGTVTADDTTRTIWTDRTDALQGRTLNLDYTTADLEDAITSARRLAAAASHAPTVKAVEWYPRSPRTAARTLAIMDATVNADIMTPTEITYNGKLYTQQIAEISHTITATTWKTRVTF